MTQDELEEFVETIDGNHFGLLEGLHKLSLVKGHDERLAAARALDKLFDTDEMRKRPIMLPLYVAIIRKILFGDAMISSFREGKVTPAVLGTARENPASARSMVRRSLWKRMSDGTMWKIDRFENVGVGITKIHLVSSDSLKDIVPLADLVNPEIWQPV